MTRLQLFSAVAVACFSAVATAFPNVPFKAVGREIQDSTGANITYVGANWPGHGEVMIPEGLQYQSISSIVGQIKTFNFNVIRLTFAIEMLDNIIDGGADVSIQAAFVKALGQENGTKVMDAVIKNNPEFKPETTRLQVFDAVAAELSKQGVYVHLDNHVSKGQWCCNGDDGNSWFGDTHFNVKNWIRGLAYMAEHVSLYPTQLKWSHLTKSTHRVKIGILSSVLDSGTSFGGRRATAEQSLTIGLRGTTT